MKKRLFILLLFMSSFSSVQAMNKKMVIINGGILLNDHPKTFETLYNALKNGEDIDIIDGSSFDDITIENLLKKLIWKGGDPKKANWSPNPNSNYWSSKNKFIQNERQKYEAVCQVYKGAREENSPLSRLNNDILKYLCTFVRYGVPFDPPNINQDDKSQGESSYFPHYFIS